MLVTPRPGADRDNILKALSSVHQEAMNLRGAGGTVVDRYNAYIRWAADSVRILGRQISVNNLDALVLTRRYWTLQAMQTSIADPVRSSTT